MDLGEIGCETVDWIGLFEGWTPTTGFCEEGDEYLRSL